MATSLAAKFSELINTTPVIQDPEDDFNSETKAQVTDKYEEDNTDLYFGSSQLRQRNARTLEDEDSRYSGRKISRQVLEQESDASESGSEDTEDLSSQAEDEIENYKAELATQKKQKSDLEVAIDSEHDTDSDEDDEDQPDVDHEMGSFEDNDNKKEDGSSDEEDSNLEDGSDDDDDDDDENEDLNVSLVPEKDMVQKFSQIDINQELQKGKAVKAQLALWDKLLECRIKAQKMLSIANRLPQHETWSAFCQQGGEEYQEIMKADKKALKRLLDKLLTMQDKLHQMNPEANQIEGGDFNKIHQSDEEIPSDTEDESNTVAQDHNSSKRTTPRKRKLTDIDLPNILEKRHKDFVFYRNTTIQKWSDKTRLASGKVGHKSFAAFEQSALKQIEQILSDKDRLRKRTQLKRSSYRVLGQPEVINLESIDGNTEKQDEQTRNNHLKNYDPEIFDDDDFYHQLLRELIERKTADVNDPIAISRQWLEIQKLRNKIKRKIDTKASKGRKIRFDVHAKLMNFMAPIHVHGMADEATTELFSSLFGKRNFQSS